MMRLRQPIAVPADRPLRVVIHARFSTEEQRQSSLDDQVASCRRFIEQNLPPGVGLDRLGITVVQEPEISGELRDRPGIDEIKKAIDERRIDLLIAEESSRLYRHMTFSGMLFNAAVDAGIRILCPTDYIDTADDDWPERLQMSQSQHSRANHFTRARIKRAQLGLWERGAAVSAVKPGYRRRPSVAATAMQPAQGPFFDDVDEPQAVVIREVFERVARGEPTWAVADWLTSIRFPKATNSLKPAWSVRNLIDLVRRPDYRGEQVYRRRVSRQQLSTGRSRIVRNAAEDVLTRQMPQLRIVSDHLWHAANEAIDRRRTRATGPTGEDHPLSGRPRRDSRHLLSTLFVCGICGAPMHAGGRHEGGYWCSAATRHECWNRTTCVREQAHAAVIGAVVREVAALAEFRDQIVARVLELHAAGGDVAAARRAINAEEASIVASLANIATAIELGGQGVATLVERLRLREQDLRLVRSRREELVAREGQRRPPPTATEILAHLESLEAGLVAGNPRAPVILRQLLRGPIRAVPHRQFGSDKVVLRAEFEIVLGRSLPDTVADVIANAETGTETGPEAGTETDTEAGAEAGASPEAVAATGQALPAAGTAIAGLPVGVRRIVVDLFEPSGIVRHAAEAHELVETGIPLVRVGEVLGVSKRLAHLCSQLGAAMAEAGVTDPFERLTERPERVSRWHRRRQAGDTDRRQAG